MLKILPANKKDINELHELAFASKASWGYPQRYLDIWYDQIAVDNQLIAKKRIFKAVSGNRIVGFYGLKGESPTLILEGFWIDPEYMGKGIGKKLFTHMVKKAAALQAKSVKWESDPNAYDFYLHMGARKTGEKRYKLDGKTRILPIIQIMVKKISKEKEQELKTALDHLLMTELKEICKKLKLPISGKKGEIIQRILTLIKEGKIVKTPKLPEISIAKKGKSYPLSPKTLIVKGSYTNNDATRNFMKKLVGEHFHFTAFGQDWIKQRWHDGNPPTYQEFADFWQKEYLARKKRKAKPKKEWAYLNFVQNYLENHPKASPEKIAQEWEKKRLKQKKQAEKILQEFIPQELPKT